MRIITEDDLPLQNDCVLSIGNFDGVHRGHAKIVETASALAQSLSSPENPVSSTVWTFGEAPRNVMTGEYTVKYITGSFDKMRLLSCYGADSVFFADFGVYRSCTPDAFADLLARRFHARAAVCGYDFHFAHDRTGNTEVLTRLLQERGCDCVVVPPVKTDGVVVSSTLIRTYISRGEIEKASQLLGRRYSFTLPVVQGRHIGRTIGFPTINQRFPEYQLVPAYGVYCCLCEIEGILYKGVANIGVKPTVTDSGELLCETHILDFNENMYDKEVRVFLFEHLRKEQRFASLDQLRAAVREDVRHTREYFAARL